jgi:hypothetical protein
MNVAPSVVITGSAFPLGERITNRTLHYREFSPVWRKLPLELDLESKIHPNRQNNRCDALPLQAPLDGVGRLVVEDSLEGMLLAENKLPRKN